MKIGDDAKEKLSFLNKKSDGSGHNMKHLSCIQEINSTGIVLETKVLARYKI